MATFSDEYSDLDPTDYDGMMTRAMKNDIVIRVAACENDVRRYIAKRLEKARVKKGLSLKNLQEQMKVSRQQLDLVLHREIGGRLHLTTILRACDVLGVSFPLENSDSTGA